jgi:Fe-S-cluster-containing dehydrogenase component
MKVFTLNIERCVGCYNCQIACKDEHCGNDWTPYAKPQPQTGHFWIKVNYEEKGTIPKVRVAYQPVMCMHCDKPTCIASCPIKGAISKREDGLVLIDPKLCSGCRNCVHNCPYGAIYYNEDLHVAQKCTGCAHLLDRGWKQPRCADSCPTEALQLVDESELSRIKDRIEVFHPEYGTQPRVYYINMPKKFIAGTVYDPVAKRIIEGANCYLTSEKGEGFKTTTDGFGDFWFENLPVGTYSLKIEAEKYPPKTFNKINTEKDVNLGNIGLS